MFFLPINTDAPIYHFPWVTISLIVGNIAAYVGWVAAGEPQDWILTFGNGVHPLQWTSWAFLHADPLHLIGNMFFLWGFGLVVEGKLGWWRYLTIYVVSATLAGCIHQLAMLGYDGPSSGALGASGVIFGLMAMSLVWAPKNEMTIFALLLFRAFVFEASIMAFCGFFLVWQVVIAALGGFSMSSELLHLTGALLGGAVGVFMLKRGLVDCEGWDIFAVWNNTYGERDEFDEYRFRHAAYLDGQIATPTEEPKKAKNEKVGAATLDPRQRIKKFLEAGDTISALGEYEKLVAFHPNWRLEREPLVVLAEGAYRDKSWDDVEPLMRQYLDRFADEDPATTCRMQLKLAKVLIDHTGQPAEGLSLLREIDVSAMPPKVLASYQSLGRRAESMVTPAVKVRPRRPV